VRAHALLHRATRPRDGAGRIVATLADYAVVRRLVEPLISSGVGATVPGTLRQTVAAVDTLGPGDVTVRQVAHALGLDKSAAWRRVQRAIDEGYLVNREGRKGHPARLGLGDPLPLDVPVLPRPRDLRRDLSEGEAGWASPHGRLQPCNPTENPNAHADNGVVAGEDGCTATPATPSDDGGVVATVPNATAPPPATENPNTDADGRDGCTVARVCGGTEPLPPWAGSTVEDVAPIFRCQECEVDEPADDDPACEQPEYDAAAEAGIAPAAADDPGVNRRRRAARAVRPTKVSGTNTTQKEQQSGKVAEKKRSHTKPQLTAARAVRTDRGKPPQATRAQVLLRMAPPDELDVGQTNDWISHQGGLEDALATLDDRTATPGERAAAEQKRAMYAQIFEQLIGSGQPPPRAVAGRPTTTTSTRAR
jgi:hypothetical protein